MACCAALTIVFAWIYRLVGWLIPHADDEFAPPAAWPRADEAIARPGSLEARTAQAAIGHACIVLGIAWFAAGMLAMHVLHLVEPIDSLALDVAFHMSGVWLATVGIALRFAPQNVVRSAA